MKLTKAQRLFVAIGHVDKEIIRYAVWEKGNCSSRGKIRPSHCRARLMQARARRKKLIREALKAWRDETDNLFIDGYQTCFKKNERMGAIQNRTHLNTMNLEYIKIGETYLLPVTVTIIEKLGRIEVTTCNDYEYRLVPSEVKTLRPIMQENAPHQSDDDWATKQKNLFNIMNGIKNTAPSPKYDPNREFRKGDKVRLVQCNGRNPFDSFNGIEYPPDETIYTVEGDEYDNGKVELYAMDSFDAFEIHHSNLKLVTPVEALEPYSVTNDDKFYHIHKHGEEASIAVYAEARHPHAKEAAEAECARLNAEYRKEQNNDR